MPTCGRRSKRPAPPKSATRSRKRDIACVCRSTQNSKRTPWLQPRGPYWRAPLTRGNPVRPHSSAPRFDYMAMDHLAFRLQNGGTVSIDELRHLAEWSRFLYSKRGALIEKLEALHVAGRLDLAELIDLYVVAEWTEDDSEY